MFSNLYTVICISLLIATASSILCLSIFSRVIKVKITQHKNFLRLFITGTTLFFIVTTLILIPIYHSQIRMGIYEQEDKYARALEPDFFKISSDDAVCDYVDSKMYFYEYIYSLSPALITTLEQHDEEATKSVLDLAFNDMFTFIEESSKQKIKYRIESLNKKATEMIITSDIFPHKNVNIQEAVITLREALNTLRKSSYKFDDETLKRVEELATHYKFPNFKYGRFRESEPQKDDNLQARATILFYRFILAQGHSKAANAMRYLSLVAYITETTN
jgi:hypothetical protein